MRIAWATDIHLDHADHTRRERFYQALRDADPNVLLLAGDMGEASTVEGYLHALENELKRPIYFVLGNHDFYRGSIAQVRQRAKAMTRQSSWLRWLPAMEVVELTPRWCLIGHDGWSDGRFGDFQRSPVQLNDYLLIEELRPLSREQLWGQLNALGDEAARYFSHVLPRALARFQEVILLTHVPPFREACLYQGKPGHPHWLPHFTCRAVGEVLAAIMAKHPECGLTVLCGHTHGAAEVHVLPNLRVKSGAAEYGTPYLQGILER
jgi:Icc protein